jgi:membrane protease subunit HflK
VIPGGLGGKGLIIGGLFLLVLWGLSGIFFVQPDEVGVILRFGRAVRTVASGPNYHLPYPI